MPAIMIAFGVLAVLGLIYAGYHFEQKRLEQLAQKAKGLGLTLVRGKDRALNRGFYQFELFKKGSNRYAANIMQGVYESHQVIAFDYHYQTRSSGANGRSQTHHHWFHCFVMVLPIDCPELCVRPEGWFDKVAGAVGFDDIDFESYEFSKRFHVKCEDKRFAYDFFHTRMMALFLAVGDPVFEADHRAMMVSRTGKQNPERLEAGLNLLTAIRDRIPKTLLKGMS